MNPNRQRKKRRARLGRGLQYMDTGRLAFVLRHAGWKINLARYMATPHIQGLEWRPSYFRFVRSYARDIDATMAIVARKYPTIRLVSR